MTNIMEHIRNCEKKCEIEYGKPREIWRRKTIGSKQMYDSQLQFG